MSSQPWLRGPPVNDLHRPPVMASSERTTLALLSRGEIDIDQGEPHGRISLMLVAMLGYSRLVRTLLNKGANFAIADDDGFSALHLSAQGGHLDAIKLLVKAGAELDTRARTQGTTPLHLAADEGRSEVVTALIEAGANSNSRALSGMTSLYVAAQNGHVAAVKVLLRAKANPLLTCWNPTGFVLLVPLDIVAHDGHSEVVDELIKEYGIEGCGGATDGVQALRGAAQGQHLEIMRMLISAGVVASCRNEGPRVVREVPAAAAGGEH